MVKWKIDMLTPQEIAKYRQRSSNAINGIEYLLKYANVIAQYEKISDKYKTIAEYIGLGQEGGNSFYNYFIPLNTDIVFLLRNSNHNNTNPYLYNRHEQLGRPNKRYIVYFKNGNTFSDNPITFLDAEHHSIPYDVNALDNETSVIAYLNSLKTLFENGETTFQPLPITTENKQYNKNTNMKQTVKLTESELRNVIAESVKSVLNEIGDTDKGQDALGQVYGRALRRAQMLGDKGAEARRLRKIANDAKDKAYSEGEKHNLFTGVFSKFDNSINTGYAKAKNNEAINRKIGRIVSECLKRNLR